MMEEIVVCFWLVTRHQNESYGYKNNNKYNQNEKIIRKLQKERVKATYSTSFSLKDLSITILASSMSQWELSVLG